MIVQLLVAGYHAADAGAAGGEALGNGVDDDHIVIVSLKLQKAHKRLAAVHELTVDLVADDKEVMLLCDVRHELQLLGGEDGAGGVAGVRKHYRTGMLVDARLDSLTDGELVAFLGLGGDGTHRCSGEGHEGAVVGVEGFGNDDLVALVKYGAEHHLQRLGAAGGDEDLLVGYGSADLAVVIDDGVDHHGDAVGWSVRENGLRKVLYRLEISLGSGNIGLTDVKMIELFALLCCLVCVGSKLSHGRKPAFFDLSGKFHWIRFLSLNNVLRLCKITKSDLSGFCIEIGAICRSAIAVFVENKYIFAFFSLYILSL